MAKIVKELVTKWTYKVDAKQLEKATKNIIKLKSKLLEVRKSSVTFGKQERNQLRTVGKGWQRATMQVDRYRRAKIKANRATGAGAGGGGGMFRGGNSGRLATLASTLGGGALGGLLVAGGGLAGIGGLIGAGSVMLAGRREQSTASISGLLGEGGKEGPKTSGLMNQLDTFAKGTPFQLGQLRELSSVLLAGGFASNEIVDSLRVMGDVTRGNNDKLNRMLFNFVQVKTVGKASAIDLRQFAMAGIPIFAQLRKQLGKSGEELADMTRKGKITFEVIKEAFRGMTSEGGRFFNGMEIQSKTLFGIFSNLKDSIDLLGEAIGAEFLGDIKELADAFREWVDENKTPIIARLKNFIESMAQFKKTVVDLSADNKVFAASIKLIAAAFVIMLARANPIMGVLFGIAVLIDDINNGLRGNESFLLDIFKAFKTEDFGEGAMDVLIKKARAAAGTTEIWDRIKSNEKLRTEGLPKLRAKTAEQLRSFRREEQFGSALNLVPPANVSSAIGSGTAGPTQSILNQTNNIQGGPFAQDEVLNRTGDLLRADKEQVRVKRAN